MDGGAFISNPSKNQNQGRPLLNPDKRFSNESYESIRTLNNLANFNIDKI
jgi:hypothetical protein